MHSLLPPVSSADLNAATAPASPSTSPGLSSAAGLTLTHEPAASLEGALPPILVADDDEDDLYFIQRLLKRTGTKHPIKTFDDGSEVVNYLGSHLQRAARPQLPNLLFLDLKMTGLGGFGFLEWARQQRGLAPLTIVVLSNSSEPGDMAQALALGAHRYLVKYPCVQTMTTIVRSVYPFTLV